MKAAGWMALAGRLALGVPLLWAGWEKMRAFGWWRAKLGEMALLPSDAVGPAAAGFSGVELLVGATLVIGFWSRGSLLLASGLYALFAGVLTWLLTSGRAAACGCFGPDSDLVVDGPAVGLRVVALVAGLTLYGMQTSGPSIDALLARRRRD